MMPLRRLVEPVVGAADPLQQARAALGRAHLDDEVDVAPVDAEVEAGGRDQPAQLARGHRRLDLAPRLDRQAAVVDADRQPLLVLVPQLLEDQLGEPARVAEDERRLVLLDQPHHVGDRVVARMAAPRDLVLGDQDRQVGLGAGIADDEVDQIHVGIGREPRAVGVGVADRRRQPDPAKPRRERLQPRSSTATASRRASPWRSRGARRRRSSAGPRTSPPRRDSSAAGSAIRAWSAAFAAASPAAAPCGRTACRRCGSRRGSAGPSPRPDR